MPEQDEHFYTTNFQIKSADLVKLGNFVGSFVLPISSSDLLKITKQTKVNNLQC